MGSQSVTRCLNVNAGIRSIAANIPGRRLVRLDQYQGAWQVSGSSIF